MSLKNGGWLCNKCGHRNKNDKRRCGECGLKFDKNHTLKNGNGQALLRAAWTQNALARRKQDSGVAQIKA